MPELRKDPIIGRWVIISTERGKRPSHFGPTEKRISPKACPFCPGNESATPGEIMAYRPDGSEANKPGWSLRVVSNKYPALIIEGDLDREPNQDYPRSSGSRGRDSEGSNLNLRRKARKALSMTASPCRPQWMLAGQMPGTIPEPRQAEAVGQDRTE